MVKVKFKSTVPCWLLCLEFLRSDCAPSSVMSAQVYCEAATSRAEMQEWYYVDTVTSGFSLGNPLCSTPFLLQANYSKGVVLICQGISKF